MEKTLGWIVIAFVVAGGAIVEGRPEFKEYRSEELKTVPSGLPLATNLDYQWLTRISQAPAVTSFYAGETGIEMPGFFAIMMKGILQSILCPRFLELDLPDGDPHKNETAKLFNEQGLKTMTVVLTDNKTYVVAAQDKSGEASVAVFRLVDPLPVSEEIKIKKVLEELKYKVKPSFEIRIEECRPA